jgi:gliding-associated putative ABC transporter substrate-binding component GldG
VLPQAVGSIGNEPQIELLPWPYFPLLYSQSNHPIAKSLDAVVMQFPNSVDTVKADGIAKTILLSTSNTSRLIGVPVQVTVEVAKLLESPSAFQQAGVPVAVLLEGNFKSLFANRLAGAFADSLAAMGQPFMAKAAKPGKILVTGDGDWVLNGFSRQGPLPMGTNPYTQYQFANQNFLQNTLDYMNDESGIMASRSKDFVLRVLDPKKLETQKQMWQWINIGGPIVLLLLAGLLFTWLRQRKFA